MQSFIFIKLKSRSEISKSWSWIFNVNKIAESTLDVLLAMTQHNYAKSINETNSEGS